MGRLLRDERGTVSIEFIIVLGGLVGAVVLAATVVGPPLHAYADRLISLTEAADAALANLQNTPTPGA